MVRVNQRVSARRADTIASSPAWHGRRQARPHGRMRLLWFAAGFRPAEQEGPGASRCSASDRRHAGPGHRRRSRLRVLDAVAAAGLGVHGCGGITWDYGEKQQRSALRRARARRKLDKVIGRAGLGWAGLGAVWCSAGRSDDVPSAETGIEGCSGCQVEHTVDELMSVECRSPLLCHQACWDEDQRRQVPNSTPDSTVRELC